MAFVPIIAKAAKADGGQIRFDGSQPVSAVGGLACAVSVALGLIVAIPLKYPQAAFVGLLLGLYLLFALKVADQWEKVAVLRLGKYVGLRGPGLFHVIPVIETTSKFVDQRIRVTDVTAESGLTRDTVPVNVDAIVFWVVWNAEKAILEVSDFETAVSLGAQTALRESIGRHVRTGEPLRRAVDRRRHLAH